MGLARSLLLTVIAAVAASAEDLARVDLEKLRDPARCEAEVRRLVIGTDEKPEKRLTSWRFHEAPQQAGNPLHVLLAGYELDFSSRAWNRGYQVNDPDELFAKGEPGPLGKTGGASLKPLVDHVLYVFDDDGREIRPFGGNNYIKFGFVYDLNGDGILERADSGLHSFSDPRKVARVLDIRTFEPKPKRLLRVVLHWDAMGRDESGQWDFTCEDEDGDGVVEIIAAPEGGGERERERVVFRWDEQSRSFESEELEGSALQVFGENDTLEELFKKRRPADQRAEPVAQVPATKSERETLGAPYEYQSLQDIEDAGIFAFFCGKPERDDPGFGSGSGDEESVLTHLPDGFWQLDAKAAALQLAEVNRSDRHRRQFQLSVDDRGGVAPPGSGWLVLDWRSASCYTYRTHQFAIRFGVERPLLIHTEHSSQGIVGANPLVDRPGYAVRILPLSGQESRFLADAVFWLDRVRSRKRGRGDSMRGMMSSSADGFATLTLFEDGTAPRDIASDTVWATNSVAERWGDDYEPETCLNLAEFLIHDAWQPRLGDRWNTVAPLEHRNLGTPIEERLKPRVDQDARRQLANLTQQAFAVHKRDPVPPSVLLDLVRLAGDEALTDLLGPIRELAAALPSPGAEDREFDNLRKRFARDHFGNPFDEKAEEDVKAKARYQALRDKRAHQPGPVLRDAVARSLRQLESADRPDLLTEWARSEGHGSAWALQRLERHYPAAHAEILSEAFEEADQGGRRRIFQTITAANPQAALKLRDAMSAAEVDLLLLDIAQFELEEDPDRLAGRVSALFKIVETPDGKEPWRRGTAMTILSKIELNKADRKLLDRAVLAEFEPAMIDAKGKDTAISPSQLGAAVAILLERPDRQRYWDLFLQTGQSVTRYHHFEHILEAVLRLSEDDPDKRNEGLETILRHRLIEADGFIDDVILTILAFDLRTMRDDLRTLATSGPELRDGLNCAHSTMGKTIVPTDYRYHSAREVLALWSEQDDETRARMWIAFVINHPYEFDGRDEPATGALHARAADGISHLSPERCSAVIEAMLAELPPGTWIPEETRDWLGRLSR